MRGLYAAVVLSLSVGWAAPAFGQYAVQPLDASRCARTFNTAGQSTNTFTQGDVIRVSGEPGCAQPGELVVTTLESEPVVLGVMNARADGGYDSRSSLRIPSRIPAGTHLLTVAPASRTDDPYRKQLVVEAQPRPLSAGGLPLTGRNLGFLGMWGLLLILIGRMMVTGARRHARRRDRRYSRGARSDDLPFLSDDDIPPLQPGSSNPDATTRSPIVHAPSSAGYERTHQRHRIEDGSTTGPAAQIRTHSPDSLVHAQILLSHAATILNRPETDQDADPAFLIRAQVLLADALDSLDAAIVRREERFRWKQPSDRS